MSIALILLIAFVILSLACVIFLILMLGGKSLRLMIKSKMPWNKTKVAWVLYFTNDRKLKFVLKKMPSDQYVTLKEGKQKEDDENCYFPEVYHQRDEDGVPVYIAMENIPVGLALKKFNLSKEINKLDKLIEVTKKHYFTKNKTEKLVELRIGIKKILGGIYTHANFLGHTRRLIKEYMEYDATIEEKEIKEIEYLKEIITKLNKIKDSLSQKNNNFVNLYDLFSSVGITKHIQKLIIMSWQNGYLAAKQTLGTKEKNKTLVIGLIIIGCLICVLGYMVYQQNKTIVQLDTKINSIQSTLSTNNLYADTNTIQNEPVVIDLSNTNTSTTP